MNRLWVRQIRGVMRLELRKTLLSLRALPIYLLAGIPLFIVFMFVLVSALIEGGPPTEFAGGSGARLFFTGLFQGIRLLIYFGTVWLFMNLFRGEVLDRSLHFYFLSPIRREVLIAGKFLAAWASSTLLFGGSTALAYAVIHGYLAAGGGSLISAAVLGELLGYLGIVALGCLGYGAVFMLVGLYFRNPIVPALIFFIWESINYLLPPLLKKFSVVFYLNSLAPVPEARATFAIIADPAPVWLAISGLLLFSAATLAVAGLRIRRMEIAYTSE